MEISRQQMIEYFEEMRQGYADVLDLVIPKLSDKSEQITAYCTFEAYHKYVDGIIVELGGKSVSRIYKNR